jgi:protein phosphatase
VSLPIPELSLVVLIGPSGAGKSTFARRHFRPTEVLSSDAFRAWVSDDEHDQSATRDAFDLLHRVAAKRLARGRLTVVDATSVKPEARKPLLELARRYYVRPVALVFDLPEEVCQERNRRRPDRQVEPYVVSGQIDELRRSLRDLASEGFRRDVWIFRSPEEVEAVRIERQPLRPDRRSDHGPFDLIGDVHGCGDELEELLAKLGYAPDASGVFHHPEGRKVVFLGDLVDRGPRVPDVLRIAMGMVKAGSALCLPGNHDDKLLRWLRGRNVRIAHGLERSIEQIEREDPGFRAEAADFLAGLPSHYVLDDGRLVAAHAGLKKPMQGRDTGRVRDFALYGETTGEVDELGLPVRLDWAAEYRGSALVVYGHTPVAEPRWFNGTLNVDTGCVFGGNLTALRYPERELVSVPARRAWAGTARSAHLFLPQTAQGPSGVDPRWLLYLPPAPVLPEPSRRPGFLEHPDEVFAHFRAERIERAVCEETLGGTRAVVVVCRDEQEARRRFGGEGIGAAWTRSGQRLIDGPALEKAFLGRLREILDRAGLWERLDTGWVCLEGELTPWSLRNGDLLRDRHAAVGAAARAALPKVVARLAEAGARELDVRDLLARHRERYELSVRFVEAYRRRCRRVASVADLRFAPFHLLATEKNAHVDKDRVWHLETLAEVCRSGPELLVALPFRLVDLGDPASEAEAARWWEEKPEGMAVKPLAFAAPGRRGLATPAMLCRSREALRLVHGPEYTLPENLERLRTRLRDGRSPGPGRVYDSFP